MKINSFIIVILGSLLISFCHASPKIPIFAVYANAEPDNSEFYTADYVNTNNVRWLESSGAGVVVIHPWHEIVEIDEILSKVNGVLFQGGSRELNLTHGWERNAKYIFEKVILMNDNENYFPLIAICQGFELMHALVAGTTDVLTQFDAYGMASPLFPSLDFDKSKMFADFTPEEKEMIEEEDTAPQFHKKGVQLSTYESVKQLDEFFRITTFGKDRNGHIYVDTVEAKNYPIYGFQHHPEKVSFQREISPVPNSLGSIIVSQRLGQFIVNEARKNKQFMDDTEIINYNYIDTMIDVKKYYYYQDAVPVLGENSLF
jgi:gamma-glutamyl hydrolase